MCLPFNVLMLIPFGMYLRYYFKCGFKKTILLTALFSFFLELTQLSGLYFLYPGPYRLADVDDIIQNTTGGGGVICLVGSWYGYCQQETKLTSILSE